MRAGELDLTAEDQGHLVGAAQVELVADQPFEERPPGGGPVEHLGVLPGEVGDAAGGREAIEGGVSP
jgi:hypothetical protein